jgi:hypothetical protein
MPHREIGTDCAGLFPAEAGPTGTQSVRGCITTQSVGAIKHSDRPCGSELARECFGWNATSAKFQTTLQVS